MLYTGSSMHVLAPSFAPAWFAAIVLLGLTACSPQPGLGVEPNGLNESVFSRQRSSSEIPPTTPTLNAATEKKFLAEGWRPGRLKLRLVVDQGGKLEEHSGAGGGTLTHIEWLFKVNIDQAWPILVAPDLSRVPPSSDGRLSPIHFVERSSSPAQNGEVVYLKHMLLSTPNSGKYANLHELTTAHGKVGNLSLSGLEPSIYGEGYELVLDINYHLNFERSKTAVAIAGENARSDENVTTRERLRMHFFPAPDSNRLQAYLSRPNSELSGEAREAERELALAVMGGLESITAGKTLIGDLRPGLKWRATKDELILSYALSDNSQPPLFGDLAGLSTRVMPNLVSLDVVIQAEE